MPLAVLSQPFDHPDWIFEMKYDGFRAICRVEDCRVALVSRRGNLYKSFPGLCSALADCIPVRDAILDGEIVHLDEQGKPQFMPLLRRRSPQQFVAFDIVWLDGRDLRKLRLIERKRILRAVVPAGSASILYANHVNGKGTELYRAICEMDLEGIVAKRKDGLYTPDETSWIKIRNRRYSQGEGRRELFERRRGAAA